MKHKTTQRVAETLLTVAVWVTVAALAATIFVLVAGIANAGPLVDEYNRLEEAGLLDHSHDGIVAVEPAEDTIAALAVIVNAGNADVEVQKDGHLVVRQPLGEGRGAIWHFVIFGADTEDGKPVAVIYVAGHELPSQPS